MKKTERLYLGIDPSLTSTGLAVLNDQGHYRLQSLQPGKSLRGVPRLVWLAERVAVALSEAKLSSPHGFTCAAIESYAYGGRGDLTGLAEAGGVIRLELGKQGLCVLSVPPASLKCYTTGHGFASKEAMTTWASRQAYTGELTNDTADAMALAAFLRDRLALERTAAMSGGPAKGEAKSLLCGEWELASPAKRLPIPVRRK